MERDYARLAAHLTAERVKELLHTGFVVVDDWFGAAWADSLRSELLQLAGSGGLAPNRTSFATPAGPAVYSKPHVFEADLHEPGLREHFSSSLREFGAWSDGSAAQFAAALGAAVPELALATGDRGRAVKLQLNEGDCGCFPWHYDNPGPPCRRALTLLVYLNPGWQPCDGGELLLAPFLAPPVSLPPLHDRAVLFLSDRVLHRTVPSHARRLTVTTWLDGALVNAPEDVGLSLPPSALADVPATAARLRASPTQRALSRAVYAEEYESSLRECMQGQPGQAEMLAAHALHLRSVHLNAPLAKLVDALRLLRSHLEPR
jgi:hypothetical protein